MTYSSPDNHGNIPEVRKKAGDQSYLLGNMVLVTLGKYTDDTCWEEYPYIWNAFNSMCLVWDCSCYESWLLRKNHVIFMLPINEQSMYHLETSYIILGQRACVWCKIKDMCSHMCGHTGVPDFSPLLCLTITCFIHNWISFSSVMVSHTTVGQWYDQMCILKITQAAMWRMDHWWCQLKLGLAAYNRKPQNRSLNDSFLFCFVFSH